MKCSVRLVPLCQGKAEPIANLPLCFLATWLQSQARDNLCQGDFTLIEALIRDTGSRQFDHAKLCHQALCALQQTGDMGSPALQGLFALRQKLMALIHGSYAGDGPSLVVEYLVGYMRSDAKPGHA